jgi:hypothetical protein
MLVSPDHAGKTYGAVTVIAEADERHAKTGERLWDIRWACCQHRETVRSKRLTALANKPPAQCRDCYEEGKPTEIEVNPYPVPEGAVVIPGRGLGGGVWIPLRGPMGHRNGAGNTHVRIGGDGYGDRL